MSIFLMQLLYLYGIHVILTYGCGQSEYESGAGECCPMCSPGSVVLTDCHGEYSTSCKLCTTGTFMDHPNGLKQCLYCKSCDSQQGLYVLTPCTGGRDTQCGVLDGYYCKAYRGTECSYAVKHTQCDPGKAIKTPGNERSDTVCEACSSGFYSPLGINCIRWTDCSARNELQHREGSAVEDVQCRPRSRERHGVTAAVILSLPVLLYTVFLATQASQQVNGGDPTGAMLR